MAGPLSHIRVLDLSRVMAGPWAGQVLADLGADVTKVERPGVGDDTRAWGPPFLDAGDGSGARNAGYFLACNRAKRSLTLDLTKPEGQRIVRALAARSDIVLENFKVGTLARFGLAYDDLAKVNPRIIVCSITGFGQDVEIARMVDRSGMEALLPVGRWRGYGGPSNFNNTTLESFTWASALGALTKYVTVLATCHVPLVHPLMVAKMASTIDHVTNGRFALNVVCGWFKNEFDMFGADMRPHDDRYKYATEWLDFLKQAWTRSEEFDFKSDSFDARAVWSEPKPVQKPHPPVMNAGGSPAAQDFTTRYCDMNFVILKDRTFLEGAKQQIDHLKAMARSHGRETRIWIHAYVVCRETEKEAKDYLHRYVYELGDWEAAGNLLRIFGLQTETLDPTTLEGHKAHFIAGHGGYPLVGTADQIVEELGKLADIGVDGCLTSFVDYKNELKDWNAKVLPLMVETGLRQPFGPAMRAKDAELAF